VIARYSVAGALAGLITLAIFYLMQSLIALADARLTDAGATFLVDFIRLKKDTELELKNRKLPEKKPPEEPPPPPDLSIARALKPAQGVEGVGFGFDTDLDLGGPDLGSAASDGDIIPLVRVTPMYPVRASERGIEGWVEVEFTITALGTVKDPTVVGYEPSSVFNRAALRAIRKWKYNPKIADGVAVERPGVLVRLVFDLEESGR
jgi:protein TonB